MVFFFSSRRRHTRFDCDWSSDVCSSDLGAAKLSGKRASGWSIGILDALTAREWATVADTTTNLRHRDEVEPVTNYFVGRLKRDLRHGNTTLGLVEIGRASCRERV